MKQIFLFICDFIVFLILLLITLNIQVFAINVDSYLLYAKILIPFFSISAFLMWLFSFYDLRMLRKKKINYKAIFFVYFITVFTSGIAYYLITNLILYLPFFISWGMTVVIITFFFLWTCLGRIAFRYLHFMNINVMIFGESETLKELREIFANSIGYNICESEIVPDDKKDYQANTNYLVIISNKLFKEHPESWPIIAEKFISKGIIVDTDFNIYQSILQRMSRESIKDAMWIMRGTGRRNQEYMYIYIIKRILDIILAITIMFFVFPLMIFIYIIIKIIDGEDPIFIQTRAGIFNKPINLYKFRTIKQNKQESEKECYTRTGRFLRHFHLDEIPQLINILKGDISFVGPRPLWNKDQEFWNHHVPNHYIRTIVKPGLTGWAQLNYKAPRPYFNYSKKNPEIQADIIHEGFIRFSYDIWYIQNLSLLLDIDIFLKTIMKIFISDKVLNH
ncbi:MAG: sugar transferase [Elusimicrobiales bacterium]|nr:sugar transferase [Elusimicrobiales bacterium]